MATFRPDLTSVFSTDSDPPAVSGPLMTLNDWAALAQAPQEPAGTQVTLLARHIRPPPYDFPLPVIGRGPDHMFLDFDDGQDDLIARGGPSRSGPGFASGYVDGSNSVTAAVKPADASPDYGAADRVLDCRFLPGVSAAQASADAQQHAAGVDQGGNAYGLVRNSNSYAADAAQPIFGYRPGDVTTWGAGTRLRDYVPTSIPGSIFTGPLYSDDLTPIIRTPPY